MTDPKWILHQVRNDNGYFTFKNWYHPWLFLSLVYFFICVIRARGEGSFVFACTSSFIPIICVI